MSEHNHNHDGCNCGHDHDHDHDHSTVTLTLDDGTVMECAVIAIFPAGENQYIALLPIEGSESEEEGEVFLYRFEELEDGEIELINIEDDDEYEIVADAFDALLDEEEFDEFYEDEE